MPVLKSVSRENLFNRNRPFDRITVLNKKTEKRIIGDLGEAIVCRFLKKKGFEIIEQNYLKPWGEIDIVAKLDRVVHFVEVKTIACTDLDFFLKSEHYRPEENLHQKKLERMLRVVETYVSEKYIVGEWRCDLAAVYLDRTGKRAKVEMIENIL